LIFEKLAIKNLLIVTSRNAHL